MMSGVQGSEVFFLFLSEGVMERYFVQLEIRQAFREGKYIMLMHEADERRGKVDFAAEMGAEIQTDKETKQPLLSHDQVDWLFGLQSITREEKKDEGRANMLEKVNKGVLAARSQHAKEQKLGREEDDEGSWAETPCCKRPPTRLRGSEQSRRRHSPEQGVALVKAGSAPSPRVDAQWDPRDTATTVDDSMEPEPEPEPDHLEMSSLQEGPQDEKTKQKKQEERERCVAMLQVLGDTLEQEYAQHGGSHWGSEDRRTKMWFIALTRTRLYVFASLVALQIVVTLVKAIVEFKGY